MKSRLTLLICGVLFLFGCDNSQVIETQTPTLPVVSEVEANTPHPLVAEFIGACVQNMPQLEKVEAMASLMDWEVLDEEMLVAFGPTEPGIEMLGWLANRGEPTQMFVGITNGAVDEKHVQSCTVAMSSPSKSEIVQQIVNSVADFERPSDAYDEAGQRYRTWKYNNRGDSFVLAVVDAPQLAPEVATLSAMYTKPNSGN